MDKVETEVLLLQSYSPEVATLYIWYYVIYFDRSSYFSLILYICNFLKVDTHCKYFF